MAYKMPPYSAEDEERIQAYMAKHAVTHQTAAIRLGREGLITRPEKRDWLYRG